MSTEPIELASGIVILSSHVAGGPAARRDTPKTAVPQSASGETPPGGEDALAAAQVQASAGRTGWEGGHQQDEHPVDPVLKHSLNDS